MQKDNGVGKLDIKKRHFIIALLVVLLIISIVIIGSRIYSVSVVGTVTSKVGKNSDIVLMEVERSGLLESDTVAFRCDENDNWKEGDRIWAICDTAMNLSDPPLISPIYIFKL